jgi:hypothetical protein
VGLLERFYEPLPDVFWTAINPVPAKSRAVAGISKAMGLKAGVPDMLFVTRSTDHVVSFVEFKANAGKLSDSQKKLKVLFDAFQPAIALYEVRSVEQFVAALDDIGIKPKRKFTLKTEPEKPKRSLSPPGKYRW